MVQTLNRLFDQVSRTMTAQSEFIGNAAHQLRNPIAGVLALAEAVARSKTPDTCKECARDLLQAAQDTAMLSEKLLMLERAEAMSPQGVRERIDLREHLPDWVEGARRTMRKGVNVTLTLPREPLWLFADPVMLREALVNLIDNAHRHGGDGLTAIAISAERTAGHILLHVSDDGRGMLPQELPKALERFSGVHETSNSGLGLAMVQAIATGHGGALLIEVEQPGLSVTIRLPALRPVAARPSASRGLSP